MVPFAEQELLGPTIAKLPSAVPLYPERSALSGQRAPRVLVHPWAAGRQAFLAPLWRRSEIK
jgi:hypothetical protein